MAFQNQSNDSNVMNVEFKGFARLSDDRNQVIIVCFERSDCRVTIPMTIPLTHLRLIRALSRYPQVEPAQADSGTATVPYHAADDEDFEVSSESLGAPSRFPTGTVGPNIPGGSAHPAGYAVAGARNGNHQSMLNLTPGEFHHILQRRVEERRAELEAELQQ